MLTKSTVLKSSLPPGEVIQKLAAVTRPSKAAADAATRFTGEAGGNTFTLRRLPSPTWDAQDRDGSWARVAGRIEPAADGSTIALRFSTPADVVAMTVGILGGAAVLILPATGGQPLLHPLHAILVLLAIAVLPFVYFGFHYDAKKTEALLNRALTDSLDAAPATPPAPAAARGGRVVLGAVYGVAGAALMIYGASLVSTPARSVLGLVLAAAGLILLSMGVSNLLFTSRGRSRVENG